jgi:glucose/arabinose dehydrogenase
MKRKMTFTKKNVFISLCGIIIITLVSYKKRYLIKDTITKIEWKMAKTLSLYLKKPDFEITTEVILPTLNFTEPMRARFFNINSQQHLLVLEREGILKLISPDNKKYKTILDLKSKVNASYLKGVLDFNILEKSKNNLSLFIIYTRKINRENHLIVSSFPISNIYNPITLKTERILIDILCNHHQGGTLELSKDGYLYISIGDGQDKDPENQAQNLKILNGKILRIDIKNEGSKGYTIPEDNPLFNNKLGYREEIFAYGFRNPFRFSIDSVSNSLLVGDVGQENFEEINIVKKGGNYGWPIMEGTAHFNKKHLPYNLQKPIFTYKHGIEGYSITGGQIYRGHKIDAIKGKYIYADYITGAIWALDISNPMSPKNQLIGQNLGNISSFNVDKANELYFCDLTSGKIKKISGIKEKTK